MLPTHYKAKISSLLAYPVNAKLISEELAGMPQTPHLSLSFSDVGATERIRETEVPFVVFHLDYSYRRASQFTSHQMENSGWNDPQWKIWIYPVRSTLKPHVKELLVNEGLPRCREWLLSRQDLTGQEEHQSLRIYYDEARDALEYKTHRHL